MVRPTLRSSAAAQLRSLLATDALPGGSPVWFLSLLNGFYVVRSLHPGVIRFPFFSSLFSRKNPACCAGPGR
jgi:hypothetical protein